MRFPLGFSSMGNIKQGEGSASNSEWKMWRVPVINRKIVCTVDKWACAPFRIFLYLKHLMTHVTHNPSWLMTSVCDQLKTGLNTMSNVVWCSMTTLKQATIKCKYPNKVWIRAGCSDCIPCSGSNVSTWKRFSFCVCVCVCVCVCFKVLFKEKHLQAAFSARPTNNTKISKTHISIAYFISATKLDINCPVTSVWSFSYFKF